MSNNRVFTVKEVNEYIKNIIENDIFLSYVSVKGEISNFKLHSSGHAYFTLKDKDSRIKCVMFRSNCMKLKFIPEDGLAVIIRGRFSVYDRDGQYQLYAEDIIPEGTGVLYKAYEQLKLKLNTEGLFDSSCKRKIPFLPHTVGIVTSPTGAAVRDIISIIKRRCPIINIILYPVQVQGEIAASEIVQGINYFGKEKNVDVIIIGRGGGSIEELWAFNEEIVARAIYECTIPIVSAVGHETDFTIADFAADIRAATPSAAAELVAPEADILSTRLNQSSGQLNNALKNYISERKMKLEYISRDSAFKKIEHKLLNLTQAVDMLSKDLEINIIELIKNNKNKLIKNIEKLDILNPASAMLRGYALIRRQDTRAVVSSTDQLQAGDCVEIELKDGVVSAQVQEKTKLDFQE